MDSFNMESNERILFSLRALYKQFGYSRYKMNKFEEYDLYANHKDFLISDGVITFTDGNGKLLALKPDVTLSIVKNSKDADGLQRVYYTENVYRMAKGTRSFKEITQVGLECMGDIDDYCIYEVLHLSKESLNAISKKSMLCVSHTGVLTELLEYIGVPASEKPTVIRLIGEKNRHELIALLEKLQIAENGVALLLQVLDTEGSPDEVLPKVSKLLDGAVSEETLDQFRRILAEEKLFIDFSVVDDIHYYNGFVFKGYVEGISSAVLSGGQYGKLMQEMGRKSDAIGFAVYFDTVEQLFRQTEDYDTECFVLYDDTTSLSAMRKIVNELHGRGHSVLCGKALPDGLRYQKLVTVKNGEVIGHA